MFLHCRVLGNFQVLSAGPATPARWRVKPVGSGGVNNHSETRSDGDEGRGEPQWSCQAKEMPDSRAQGSLQELTKTTHSILVILD